jgi:hypothetical protein
MITGRIPWHAYLTKSKMLDVTYQVLHIKEKHVLLGPSVIGDFLLYPPLCNNTLFINYLFKSSAPKYVSFVTKVLDLSDRGCLCKLCKPN